MSETNGSLAKGLRVLASFDDDHPTLTAKEIAERTHINRTSVYRVIKTLEDLSYLDRVDSSRYRPSIKVIQLGRAALESLDLPGLIRPYLEKMRDDFTEATAVNLGVLDGPFVVYILRLKIRDIIEIRLHVGSRLPAYLSSMGKVILAHLPEQERETIISQMLMEKRTKFTIASKTALRNELNKIAEQGLAINDQELTIGLRSVAVPIFVGDRVIAATSVAMPATRSTLEMLRDHYGRKLKETAAVVSDKLTEHYSALDAMDQ